MLSFAASLLGAREVLDILISSCRRLVQIEIKNKIRSVYKEIGSENPPYSQANSPENASQANKPSPVDFPEELESGGESASFIFNILSEKEKKCVARR